jgi:CelD/BcsL family acetyltransferase involved in cellulose biosynthesis
VTADPVWSHEVHTSFEAIRDEWDRLAVQTCAMPFMRPGWMEAWWRAFGRSELALLTVRADGELRAVLPAARSRLGLAALANEHTPWLAPLADGPEAATHLAVAASGLAPAHIRLPHLVDDDPATGAFLSVLRGRGWRVLERTERSLVIPTTASWQGYVSGLSRSRASGIRRSLRRLGEVGPVRLESSPRRMDPRELDGLLGAGLALEASGWKGTRGTAMLARPEVARFYREIAQWASADGSLGVTELFAGDRRVTWSLGLESNGRHYALKLGVDPEFATFGPGILHLYLLAQRCFEGDTEWFELLGWDEPWKRSLASEHRVRRDAVFYAPGLRGGANWAGATAARAGIRAAGAAYRRARAMRGQA